MSLFVKGATQNRGVFIFMLNQAALFQGVNNLSRMSNNLNNRNPRRQRAKMPQNISE